MKDFPILLMYTYIKFIFISIRYDTLKYDHTTQNIILPFTVFEQKVLFIWHRGIRKNIHFIVSQKFVRVVSLEYYYSPF